MLPHTKYFTILLLMLVSFFTTSCSSDDWFTVEGTVNGNLSINMRICYYANDAMQNILIASREGKFAFKGNAPDGTMVEIYDNDYHLLARFYTKDGDKLKLKIDTKNPYNTVVEGNEEAETLAKWMKENASVLASDNHNKINTLIAKYIGNHKSSITSSILLSTMFDASTPQKASQADSLLALIDSKARPPYLFGAYNNLALRVTSPEAVGDVASFSFRTRRDTVITFNPSMQSYSLLAFSGNIHNRADSIVPTLKRLSRHLSPRRFTIVDYSMDIDTLTWAHSVRPDSATWTQGWAPGGVSARGVDRLALPRLPFFIVTDSTGTQLYRGASATDAEKLLNSLLNTN